MLHNIMIGLFTTLLLVQSGCDLTEDGKKNGEPIVQIEDRYVIDGQKFSGSMDNKQTLLDYEFNVIKEVQENYLNNEYFISVIKSGYYPSPAAFIVKMTDGYYIEVADLAQIYLVGEDKVLSTMTIVDNAYANISYLTSISYGLALYNYNQSLRNTESLANIVDLANSDVSNLYGIDIHIDRFVDTTDSTVNYQSITVELEQSMLHAAISQFTLDLALAAGNTQRVRPYTTIDFIALAIVDILADGLLNGLGVNGELLTLGSKGIDANTYRHELAISLIKYTESENYGAGFSKLDWIEFATIINNSNSELFGGSNLTPLDEGGPTITNFTPADGTTVAGETALRASLYDPTGISEVEFLMDGSHYSNAGNPLTIPINQIATFPLYIPAYQDIGTVGTHTLTIKVKNTLGTITETSNTVTFDNS